MEKVERFGRISACIERVFGYKARVNHIERMFGYKARVNRIFLNISRLLEITERECNELLLSVKNSQELGSSPFSYTASVILRLLPGEVVRGEHFVIVDLLKSISSSSSQAGSA